MRTLKLRTALFGLGAALLVALAVPNIASAANMQALTNAPPAYQAYLPGIVLTSNTGPTFTKATSPGLTLSSVDNDIGLTSSTPDSSVALVATFDAGTSMIMPVKTYGTSSSPPPTSQMTLVAMNQAVNDTINPPTGYYLIS
ncbi:hypothetical protein HQ403_01495 [Candidatus Kaiserbacteria bacterium]|nr:hypothetical protein [Candidatus Kaiserbacteria bacterium]